ncbi:HIT family protein [Streptomyces sp. NPDC057336]|uniref:HIT family protein n=1 Tax=Streptomyces sp. NPDC057336 TaxID=3346102 RepID=UPI0036334E84
MRNCVLCAIAAGEAPAVIVREWPDALAVRPRSGGVHPGHVFVLPRVHVEDAGTDPEVTWTPPVTGLADGATPLRLHRTRPDLSASDVPPVGPWVSALRH